MKNVKAGHTHPVVCLDAGHYGKYNRSPVVKDYYESEMNWKLHNLLAAELEGYGIQVTKTRADQATDLALYSRGKASKGCDLFISVHSNACDTESVDRPVGIYLVDDDCGAIDAQSKEIAGLLAETVREVMQTNGKAQTYSKLASSDRDGDGKKNDDYYGVLYGAHQVGTAGVIIEHSFHTNTRAAKWLLEDANLQTLAQAEAKTIAEWFGMTAAENAPEEPEEPETAVTAKGTACTVTLPLLRKGDSGESVKALQILLKGWGYALGSYGPNKDGVDGEYGDATANAVLAFQKKVFPNNPAEWDRIAGAKTWAALLGL